ncbi:hypothetical protein AB2664_30360, partial [Bacillus wiedmannii]|uniref:hypothetical protein n=2 Tax=Bacteria TaxID=2 RepID=UPI003463E855
MTTRLLSWARRLIRELRMSFRETEDSPVLTMAPIAAAHGETPMQHLESFSDIDQMHPAFQMLKVDW